jgi:anti-sigma B factor antagonist
MRLTAAPRREVPVQVNDLLPLRVTTETDGTTTVLRLAGELDLATADVLRFHLRQLLAGPAEDGVHRLVVDLGGLDFIDVSGLNALLEARSQLTALDGSLALRRPRPMVTRMLSLLGVEDQLLVDS